MKDHSKENGINLARLKAVGQEIIFEIAEPISNWIFTIDTEEILYYKVEIKVVKFDRETFKNSYELSERCVPQSILTVLDMSSSIPQPERLNYITCLDLLYQSEFSHKIEVRFFDDVMTGERDDESFTYNSESREILLRKIENYYKFSYTDMSAMLTDLESVIDKYDEIYIFSDFWLGYDGYSRKSWDDQLNEINSKLNRIKECGKGVRLFFVGNYSMHNSLQIYNMAEAIVDAEKAAHQLLLNFHLCKTDAISGSLSVFPNPAKEHIYFQADQSYGNIYYEIYDTQGRLFQRENINNPDKVVRINISSLFPGSYRIKLTNDNSQYIFTDSFIKH